MFADVTFLSQVRLSLWYPMVPLQEYKFREESKELNNED